ncbi:MAG: cytochrome c [Chloroflexi bacterium]|nr:cytochrome c [Chloroflexota bacterium]
MVGLMPLVIGRPRARVWVFLGAALLLSACGTNGQTQLGTPVSKAVLQRGEALYNAQCLSCHGGATGGGLKDIPPPHNANGHTWHHPDQQITDIVLNGFSFSLDEPKMPAFKDKLTEEEVEAILAYIKTWWTPEQRQWQATVTAQTRERSLSGPDKGQGQN